MTRREEPWQTASHVLHTLGFYPRNRVGLDLCYSLKRLAQEASREGRGGGGVVGRTVQAVQAALGLR
jgi:hypothetical protein